MASALGINRNQYQAQIKTVPCACSNVIVSYNYMVHCFQEHLHVLIAAFMYQPQLGFCLDGTNYKLLPEPRSGQLKMGSHLDINNILVEYFQLRITDMFADHQIFITPCPWSILFTFRIMWSTAFIKDRRMHLLEGRWLLVERGIPYLDTKPHHSELTIHQGGSHKIPRVQFLRYPSSLVDIQ